MQFDLRAVSLSATIAELIERMRQDAYNEGYEDGLSELVRRASSASSSVVGTSARSSG